MHMHYKHQEMVFLILQLHSKMQILDLIRKLNEEMEQIAESVGSYAFLLTTTDAGDSTYQDKQGRYMMAAVEAQTKTCFIVTEIQEIPEEELKTKVQDEMNAKKEKAQKLQAQLKNLPKNFAKLAKENSEDIVSATRGGDLGFFAKEEMVPTFANVAFSIAPNTISDVVKTDFGYHIIMVTDRNEAGTLTFEQSKKDIINYLEGRDKVEILKSKIESLKNEAKIEYLDSSFNPEEIQKKIKAEAEKSPELKAIAGLATNQNK